jgi:hypothetical protein
MNINHDMIANKIIDAIVHGDPIIDNSMIVCSNIKENQEKIDRINNMTIKRSIKSNNINNSGKFTSGKFTSDEFTSDEFTYEKLIEMENKYYEKGYTKETIRTIYNMIDKRFVGEIFQINTQQEDMKFNYDITLPNPVNQVVIFDKPYFLELIVETYQTDADIIRQFLADFTRVDVMINNENIKSIDLLMMRLSDYNRLIDIGSRTISLMMLCLLMICQSSFYISFYHQHNKLNMLKESLSNNHMMNKHKMNNNDKRLDYHLTDQRERKLIEFIISDDKLTVLFSSAYQVIDPTISNITDTNPQTIVCLNQQTVFDINQNITLITYKITNPIKGFD